MLRARLQGVLATLGAALALLTLKNAEWIEAMVGVDPDHGDGLLELGIVAGLGVSSVIRGRSAVAACQLIRSA